MCFFGNGGGANALTALKNFSAGSGASGSGSTSAVNLLSTQNAYNNYATAQAEAGNAPLTRMDWAKQQSLKPKTR